MTTTRTRPQSTTHDRTLDIFNLDPMRSPTQAPNTLYGHNQGRYTHREDQPRGRALNDSTRTHNTHPTTSYHLVIKLTTMRHYERACRHFCLPQLQSGAFRSQASLVRHRSQHPAASTLRLSEWCLKQWPWERSLKKPPTARLPVPQAAVLQTSPSARSARLLPGPGVAVGTARKCASRAL